MLVSVLINNYNYGRYLEYCIKSVLNQTYDQVEIILYDDGSTDESIRIAKKYSDKIKIITNPNYGKTPSQNQANAIYKSFSSSKGDIICLLDSDDAFYSTKIEKVVDCFKKSQNTVMVQHIADEINQQNQMTGKRCPLLKQVNIKSHIYKTNNLFHLFSTTSCLCFKRSYLEKVLPLKEDKFHLVWPDGRLRIKALFNGKVFTIHKPLTQYRKHYNNDSYTRRDPVQNKIYNDQLYSFFNGVASEYNSSTISKPNQALLAYDNIFSNLLNEKILLNFVNRKQQEKLIIWGAGEAGQSIYYYLKEKSVPVVKIIDKDPRKKGSFIDGIPVDLPDRIEWNPNHHKVIIAAYYAKEPIEKNLISHGLDRKNMIFPFAE